MPARRTHCKQGHALTDDNIYCKPSYPKSRRCKKCRQAEWTAANRLRKESATPRVYERDLPPPSSSDIEWGTGLFEGEGTVTISKSGGRKRPWLTRSVVSICMTDREAIAFFRARWGGAIRPRKPPSKKSKPAFEWVRVGTHAAFFLRDILPYIRTERVRTKVELVLKSEEIRRADPPHAREELGRILAEIRVLNKRGVDPQTPEKV